MSNVWAFLAAVLVPLVPVLSGVISTLLFEKWNKAMALIGGLSPAMKQIVVSILSVAVLKGFLAIGVAVDWVDVSQLTAANLNDATAAVIGFLLKGHAQTKEVNDRLKGLASELFVGDGSQLPPVN